MTNQELEQQYIERADAEIAAGGKIKINTGIPYIAITMSDGTEYYFQGEEAEEMIEESPDWCYAEEYILAMAQNW